MNIVVFRLGQEEYSLPVTYVQEIQGYRQQEPPRSIPGVPDFFEGIINLRGNIIPVMDLKKHLGIGQVSPDRDTCYIITEIEQDYIGILVDAVLEVIQVPDAVFEPAPRKLKNVIRRDYIQGVGRLQARDKNDNHERLVVLLDLAMILSEDELHKLKAMPR